MWVLTALTTCPGALPRPSTPPDPDCRLAAGPLRRYAIGSSLFGWLADTHGRKAGLLASSLSAACVTLLCAASSSYGMYVAGRLLQGLCCSGLPIAAYVLATESVGPTYRGRAGTGSQLLYHLGEWILPVMALLLQDWRLLYLAVSVLMVLTAALAAAVPESPRWQLLHGRQAQAVRTLAWLACLNGRQLPHNVIQQLQCGAVQDAKQPSPAHEDAPGAAPTAKGSKAAAGAAPAAVSAEPWHWQDSEVASLLAPANASQSLMQADCQKGHLQQHDQHSSHHQHQQQQQPQGQLSGSNHVPARHAGDTVWMVFWDPLLARLFWVSVSGLAWEPAIEKLYPGGCSAAAWMVVLGLLCLCCKTGGVTKLCAAGHLCMWSAGWPARVHCCTYTQLATPSCGCVSSCQLVQDVPIVCCA